jgi:outer membrane protein assembly factor BamB
MKRFAGVMVCVLLAQATATAQITRRHTRPILPDQAALDRLNLKLAWRTYVPTDGLRDGINYIHVFPDVVLVQTHSGTLVALDVRDGGTLWRAKFGTAYRPAQPVGANKKLFLLIQGSRLYALSRKTGQLQWELDLPNAANAAPAADDESFYVPLGTGKLVAYEIIPPQEVAAEKAKRAAAAAEEDKKAEAALRGRGESPGDAMREALLKEDADGNVRKLWTHVSEARMEGTPLLTQESVLLADTAGTIVCMSKENSELRYRFPTDAPVSAPLAQHGEYAYLPSQDYNLYALDISAGVLQWRFAAGGPILRAPKVTDDSIYLGIANAGLYRVDRTSGKQVWRNPQVERFVASNKKYVYGMDSRDRLVLVDQNRGRSVALLDTSDFNVPVANEWTDRVYLASNDGLIVCLHDRDYRTPLRRKNVGKQAPVAKPQTSPLLKPGEDKPAGEDKPKAEDKPKPDAKPDKGAEKPKPAPKPKADDKGKMPDKPKGEDKK